ncbi:MAG: hypothetical protein HC769_33045 [Cyanobacteria bacterium CRU_2_1]|nr:hypothetical protein [Cyanobacteria bacterium CRU_2_1]
MKWHYAGEMTIHFAEGGWDVQQVDGVFDLPDRNVRLIRDFLYSNRELILRYKYQPPMGDVPWGDVDSQMELRQALSVLMSDEQWTVGVADRQVKAYLVAFYHHLLENLDLYGVEVEGDREMAVA